MSGSRKPLVYEGCCNFRNRIVLSILSGRMIKITNVRSRDEETGLAEFEAGFLRLIDKLTNGTRIEINETGTTVTFIPGVLIGGVVQHECSRQRCIGYFLEPVMMLAPFCKKPLQLTLRGITNSQDDVSLDQLRHGAVPVLRRFLLLADEQLELKTVRRGVAPLGGGVVTFKCPVQRTLRAVQWLDPGRVRHVRGVAFAVRVSSVLAQRTIEAAKQVLCQFVSDVYISSEHWRGEAAGKSPGFGISLVGETTSGACITADVMSAARGDNMPASVAEELGVEAACRLLDEIYRSGCVDSFSQCLMLLFMALGQKDVSKVSLGPLTAHTIDFMRLLRDFFSTMFRVENGADVAREQDEHEQNTETRGGAKLVLTCIGSGFSNLSKTIS